jgi:hypothetical protein
MTDIHTDAKKSRLEIRYEYASSEKSTGNMLTRPADAARLELNDMEKTCSIGNMQVMVSRNNRL